jgi:hypothetical protein
MALAQPRNQVVFSLWHKKKTHCLMHHSDFNERLSFLPGREIRQRPKQWPIPNYSQRAAKEFE